MRQRETRVRTEAELYLMRNWRQQTTLRKVLLGQHRSHFGRHCMVMEIFSMNGSNKLTEINVSFFYSPIDSFRSCVLSWFFMWHLVWLSVMQLRHYFFIGTLNPMLNRLANQDPDTGKQMFSHLWCVSVNSVKSLFVLGVSRFIKWTWIWITGGGIDWIQRRLTLSHIRLDLKHSGQWRDFALWPINIYILLY